MFLNYSYFGPNLIQTNLAIFKLTEIKNSLIQLKNIFTMKKKFNITYMVYYMHKKNNIAK